MRYTFNLKKAYDDYYLYSHNTVYGTGEKPRSEYVSPYKENYYIPEHNITKRMCYNKLGQYEDIDTDPTHLSKINQALEIIKNYGYFDEQGDLIVHLPTNRKQEHELLKEVLL